jgi:uncharacterized protein YjiS (DUF1127 family)
MTPTLLTTSAAPRLVERLGMQFHAVFRMIKNWRVAVRNRREVAMLLEADNSVLRDLGLTRLDVAAAMSEPVWRDPSARLLIWSVERRASARVMAREIRDGLIEANPTVKSEAKSQVKRHDAADTKERCGL